MNKIPLWGKIAGGCGILFLLFLLIAGCTGIALIASNDTPEPTSSPETTTSQEAEPTEEESKPEPTEEETVPEPEIDTTGGINTCIPDQDQAMAEVVASVTSADVTIYADQVYMVAENEDLTSFYVAAGSDVGLILIYTSTNVNGDPMAYAANDVAYDYTVLYYPEDMGAPAIDTESDAYKVAEGCVS